MMSYAFFIGRFQLHTVLGLQDITKESFALCAESHQSHLPFDVKVKKPYLCSCFQILPFSTKEWNITCLCYWSQISVAMRCVQWKDISQYYLKILFVKIVLLWVFRHGFSEKTVIREITQTPELLSEIYVGMSR